MMVVTMDLGEVEGLGMKAWRYAKSVILWDRV